MADTTFFWGRSANCWDNLDESNDSLLLPSIVPSFQITDNESVAENVQKVAYEIFAPLTITVGIIGNILNLTILTTRPFIVGATRVYLTALALSDLTVMLTVIPMLLRWTGTQGTTYPAAFYHAHIELFLSNTFIASSIFIVVCLTVDRYLSVCLPTTFRSVRRQRIAKYAVGASYIAAVAVSTPLIVLKTICTNGTQHWHFRENNTVTSTLYWLVYIWFAECVVRLGPCVILSLLNVLIIKKFRRVTAKSRIFRDNAENSRNNRRYQQEKRLIALLRAIVVLFFLTMTPSAILSLLYNERQEAEMAFQVFRAAANNLELLNFSMNFCIYFLYSREFRNTLRSVFTGCTQCEEIRHSDGIESDGGKSFLNVVNMNGLYSDCKNSNDDADRSIFCNKIERN